MSRESIKVLHGALDEVLIAGKPQVVLRGVVDPTSLASILVGDYQREILPLAKIQDLVDAMSSTRLPDIELGMRGGNFRDQAGAFYLQDDVYVVDGLQRITAARQLLSTGGTPHLGATIHFNTTDAWERERFRALNVARTKLSPNIMIRNQMGEFPVIKTLHDLTVHEHDFLLCGKVCWQQNMRRGQDLITARTLVMMTGFLHSHIREGARSTGIVNETIPALQRIMTAVGRNVFRANVRTFWELIDYCWGIRGIVYVASAGWLKGAFLWSLANMLMLHHDFWRGHRLYVDASLQRKFKLFPVATDPTIAQLAGSAGKARDQLLNLLIDHVNSGKRTRRLRMRAQRVIGNAAEELEDDPAERSVEEEAVEVA